MPLSGFHRPEAESAKADAKAGVQHSIAGDWPRQDDGAKFGIDGLRQRIPERLT